MGTVEGLGGREGRSRRAGRGRNTWTWWLGAAAVGYMVGDHHLGSDQGHSVGGYEDGHYDGGHDVGGGFDGGGGFGGDIGGF